MTQKRQLYKVWFENLFKVEGEFPSLGGVSPGGALFEEGYYYEVDFKDKTVVLHFSCRVKSRKDRVEFCFEGGSVSCVHSSSIKKIERVQREVVIEPLLRKDLFLSRINVPSWQKMEAFLMNNREMVLGFRHRETNVNDKPAACFQVLLKYKSRKKFLDKYFAEKLTPPGRIWMVLSCHPTAVTVKSFGPF